MPKSIYFLQDNHTSVYGMREAITHDNPHVAHYCLSYDYMNALCFDVADTEIHNPKQPQGLLAFSAQSNYCGRRYPVRRLINHARNGVFGTVPLAVCVDAASFVSSGAFNLREVNYPNFVPLSFYKMFGYPTGIGCLLVRLDGDNSANCSLLTEPRYFGGGTIDMGLPGQHIRAFRRPIHER